MGDKKQQANQSQFYFTIGEEQLGVETFACQNYGLAEDYQFVLQTHSEHLLESIKLINQIAILKVVEDTDIYGIITDIQSDGITPDSKHYSYAITFNSPLHTLGNTYAFLLRQLNHFGLFFTFIGSTLIITDDINQLPNWQGSNGNKLKLQMSTGCVKLSETAIAAASANQLLSHGIKLRDYNYNTPELELTAHSATKSSTASCGEQYIYGENFASQNEAEQFAKIRQQALDWQRYVVELETDCPSLLPGFKIELTDHPIASYNQTYRIVSITEQGDQSVGQVYSKNHEVLTYHNKITLIPANIPYRTPITKPKPLYGIQTANIESIGGDYAYLDNQGRYHIRMPYDVSNTAQGQASNPIRLTQPYSGQNYGMHFPLHAGTEVLLMHKSEDNNLLQSDNDHIVKVANTARIKTQNQDIHIQSGQDLKLSAKNDINFDTENKDLTLKSSQHTVINTKDMAAINSAKQDINIHNVNGSTYFKVNQGVNINTVKPGNVTIAQSGAKIQINSDGSIAIQAKSIDIKGKQNNLQSNQANLGGTG